MSADCYHKRKVGNRVLSPETQMMGYGFDPALVRRLAEAADLPHLDVRLPQRAGRQGFLRLHLGPARAAAGQGRGPGVFALQQSESRSARGPPRVVGGRRGRGGVLERHVGDLHHAVGLSEAQRLPAHERAAVRRHRNADRPDPAGLRHRRRGRAGCHLARGGHGRREDPRWRRPRRAAARWDCWSPRRRPTRPTAWWT